MKLDIDYLYKKLLGESTPEGEAILHQWMSEAKSHQKFHDDFMENAIGEKNWVSADQVARYKLSFEYKLEKKVVQIQRKRRRKFAYAAAATVLVLLTSIIFFRQKLSHNEPAFRNIVHEKSDKQKDGMQSNAIVAARPKRSNKKILLVTSNGAKLNFNELGNRSGGLFSLSDTKEELLYASENDVKRPAKIKMNQLFVGRGAEFSIRLSDGSRVWLNSDTRLEYPDVFPPDIRSVKVHGEAYFEVAKDEKRPFTVDIGSSRVKVYGTQFNINNRDRKAAKTTLVEGLVSITVKGLPDRETKLIPGNTCILNEIDNHRNIINEDVEFFIGWKSGKYLFKNAPITELMSEMALWYDLDVEYHLNDPSDLYFTGSLLRRLSLQELLSLIEMTNHVKLSLNGNHLIVSNQ